MRLVPKLFLLLALVSPDAWGAQKIAYYFGAGLQPNHANIGMEPSLNAFVQAFEQRSSYQSAIHFGGAHPQDAEVLARAGLTGVAQPFTPAAVEKMIGELTESVRTGRLREGDQVAIVFVTHGLASQPEFKTHLISYAGPAGSWMDLDLLFPLRNYLEISGVKLAIMDFSCGSGGTVSLASRNTCVITGTDTDQVMSTGFPYRYLRSLQAGRSLEDSFLVAKRSYAIGGMPRISTEAGRRANEIVAPLKRYFWDRPERLLPVLDSTDPEVCCGPSSGGVMKVLAEAEKVLVPQGIPAERRAYLLELFKQYRDPLLRAVARSNAIAAELRRIRKELIGPRGGQPVQIGPHSWSWIKLAEISDPDQQKRSCRAAARRKFTFADCLASSRKAYDELMLDGSFAELVGLRNRWVEGITEFVEAGRAVRVAENALFDRLYAKLTWKVTSSDACRDFVF